MLPNFVANRLAAQLGLEGPSLSVSAEALSGLVALEQAAVLLVGDDVDAVIAGAVDLPIQPGFAGVSAARHGALREGGALFVLRRAEDVDPLRVIATIDFAAPADASTPAPPRAATPKPRRPHWQPGKPCPRAGWCAWRTADVAHRSS